MQTDNFLQDKQTLCALIIYIKTHREMRDKWSMDTIAATNALTHLPALEVILLSSLTLLYLQAYLFYCIDNFLIVSTFERAVGSLHIFPIKKLVFHFCVLFIFCLSFYQFGHIKIIKFMFFILC